MGWIDRIQYAIVQGFLVEEGWKAGAPSNQMASGKYLASLQRCECGRKGLVFAPYQRGREVRAFDVCPTCGRAKEA